MKKKFFYIKNNAYLCRIKIKKEYMEYLDIEKVLKHYGISQRDAANIMFPKISYPMAALKRVLRGTMQIDCKQIATLADFIGVPVCDLFTLNNDWKGAFNNEGIVLTKGNLRAVLNNSVLTVFKGNEQIAYEYIQSKIITVSEFINHIEQLIKTNNNEECSI